MLTGVALAGVAAMIAGTGLPIFSDGWHLLPTATGPRLSPLGWAAAGAAVPLGLAVSVLARLVLGRVGRPARHGIRSRRPRDVR